MESISVFDIFKIGVGPSSSHTMGPWKAAGFFLSTCQADGIFESIQNVRVEFFGSLAKTGKGHGTDVAVMMGLLGEDPARCDPGAIFPTVESIRAARVLALQGKRPIPFDPSGDLVFNKAVTLPFHPNGLRFTAQCADGSARSETYYSIGGGFVIRENENREKPSAALPMPIEIADDLLGYCRARGLSIPAVVLENEKVWRGEAEIREKLRGLWREMRACAFRGSKAEGVLPGGLGVVRRAAGMSRRLLGEGEYADAETWTEAIRARKWSFQETLKWVSCFALAVNEENASFGRVVTAPTNGAAGVIPAVLLYYVCFCGGGDTGVEDFLLTAGEFGSVFKKGATISAALGGCQAEIGVSSAMAAAALTQVLGGTPEKAMMAAEIAMEHHLGMTCDPVGGLVQIPCIERNTMGAIKAITACNLALETEAANAKVSLDAVINSMRETARDMSTKYKETAEGGLAQQIPVNVAEC